MSNNLKKTLNNQSGFAHLLILALILAGAIGGAGAYVASQQPKKNQAAIKTSGENSKSAKLTANNLSQLDTSSVTNTETATTPAPVSGQSSKPNSTTQTTTAVQPSTTPAPQISCDAVNKPVYPNSTVTTMYDRAAEADKGGLRVTDIFGTQQFYVQDSSCAVTNAYGGKWLKASFQSFNGYVSLYTISQTKLY